MGGGALPIAFNKKNKKVYLLFGKENEYLNKDSPGFSDFGGGEKAGESALDTALREGCEELNGFFGCEGEIKRLIKENLVTSLNHDRYTTFLFEIEYDDNLPYYFNNNYKFLKSHVNKLVRNPTNGLFEKSIIKWMTFDDLRKERSSFRSYYRNVVDVILENEDDIVRKLKGSRVATVVTATATNVATTATNVATTATNVATTATNVATTRRTPTTRTPTTRMPTTRTPTTKTFKKTSTTNRYNNYKYDTQDSKTVSIKSKNKHLKKKKTKTKTKTKKNKKWFDTLW
jgi:NUDIX domain